MNISKILPHTKHLNVLYAEDSLVIRKDITKKISEIFKDVSVAKDGQEAIELYKKFHEESNKYFDIIITDLEMPIMGGYELSKQALDFNSKQKIIAVSSINDFNALIQLINIGVKKFIPKPIEDSVLYDVIHEVAQEIRREKLDLEEQKEIEQHNIILKKREDVFINKLQKTINELEEFKHAMDISALVSKSDLDGNITYVNEEFCKLSGYSEGELIGKNHNILNSGKMVKSFYKKLWNTITAKKNYHGLFCNSKKNKEIYFIKSTITPILDTNGDIVEYISVSFDVTQQMNALENANEARKSKENFFINMSHEMRTPLNSILGFTSLLIKRLKGDEKTLNILNTILENSNDLQNLVSSLLDINKLYSQSLSIEEREFSPNDNFIQLFDKYNQKALQKNQHFESIIDSKLPLTIIGDSKRIFQVYEIILDNAVKYTPENGKVKVTVDYDDVNEILSVSILDNGVGISKENQEKIFDFEQADSSSTRSHEGTGIDLTIAKRIVQLLNGSINLKSSLGKGSLFEIELPLKSVH